MREKYVWSDEAGIDEFLRAGEIGHLTTIDADGWPHTVPVNYVWYGGSAFFHTGQSGKIERLRANPKVSFVVTEALGILTSDFSSGPCQDTQLGRSVMIRGLAREIKSPERKLMALSKLIAKYDPEALADKDSEKMAPEAIMDQPGFKACLVVEIEVASLTAHRHLLNDKPEKYRRAVAAHFQKLGQQNSSQRDLRTAVLISRSI